MYSTFKFNGLTGLFYFQNKTVTLDYRNKKIAASSEAIDINKLKNNKYAIIPLICSTLSNEKDLLYFEGEVNGIKGTIYLETGSSQSFYSNKDLKDAMIELKLGDKKFNFKKNELKYGEIRFRDEFKYPLSFALNSDLLKSHHFVITIDKIHNNLNLNQN